MAFGRHISFVSLCTEVSLHRASVCAYMADSCVHKACLDFTCSPRAAAKGRRNKDRWGWHEGEEEGVVDRYKTNRIYRL